MFIKAVLRYTIIDQELDLNTLKIHNLKIQNTMTH